MLGVTIVQQQIAAASFPHSGQIPDVRTAASCARCANPLDLRVDCWLATCHDRRTECLTAQKLDCVTIADKLFSRGRTDLLSMLQNASSSFCISVILPDNCMSTQGSHGKQFLISKNKVCFMRRELFYCSCKCSKQLLNNCIVCGVN